jgi:hypothetical protein
VALHAYNLGMVLQALDDLAGARTHIEHALRIMNQYAPDSPNTRLARQNLFWVKMEIAKRSSTDAHP